jgi:hypothetical protein
MPSGTRSTSASKPLVRDAICCTGPPLHRKYSTSHVERRRRRKSSFIRWICISCGWRQAELDGDRLAMRAAQKMRCLELDLISRADTTIVVSAHEAELLRTLLPDSAVHQIPILRETSSIDEKSSFGRFASLVGLAGRRAKRQGILFIGGYEHSPNAGAVNWFVREVWPLVKQKDFPSGWCWLVQKHPMELERSNPRKLTYADASTISAGYSPLVA